jgi:amino acid adenylation domain-containing protein
LVEKRSDEPMENVQDIYELSPMQHGLLFDSVTAGDSGMYLIQLEYFFKGKLSVPEFERAWQQTIDHNPILRTCFHWEGMPKPLQVVQNDAELSLTFEDWSELSAEEREQRATEFREADRRRGVEFENAPLMRLALFQEGEDAFRLVWTFHHILMEGWSASLVLAEVRTRYSALVSGETATVAEHRSYRDFVSWFQEQDRATAEAYWRSELEGLESPTHPGIDRSSSGMHAPVREFDERRLELSAEASQALLSFAKNHSLTPNTLMQGAWAVLLSRYAGEQDVVFGTMVSGRSVPLEGVETIIGLFVNLLPTRVGVGADEALVGWLQRLQERQVRQREFEYLSLADVKRWSDVPAGLPLFESLLVFENWAGDLTVADWAPGLEVRDVRGHHGSPGHPMMLTVVPGPQLSMTITYDRHRFDADAIERLLANLNVLLEALPVDPDRRLADLPLLSEAEGKLLDGFNDTATDDGMAGCVHEQVAAQAVLRPDAVALRFEQRVLSYAELRDMVQGMAARLSREGVGRGSIVALCVDRSPEMVAMLLAVLELGAAYVPLDPAYPAARIAYILEDCGASVLVTETDILSELADHGARVILLDAPGEPGADGSAPSGDATAFSGEELAYVIYTSGSTGNPKGVEVTHCALSNFIDSMRREPGLTADDVLVAVTTLAFDIAGLELYLPLTTGAQLVLASRSAAADASSLTTLLEDTGATVMQATPATWRMLIQVEWPGRRGLKVLCGGEALPPELVTDLRPLCRELWNMYGPTETTIWSALTRVESGERVTVGRPIGNTQVHILDDTLARLPIGVTGELYIGGAGLARGYRGRADLTAEKFLPDPYRDDASARIYRTGDLARLHPDGALEILGRIDHQVKIRGFRIELGEIEATLARHDEIAETVVLARNDGRTGTRLVAYMVSPVGVSPDLGELRTVLRESLPEYMVPAVFVPLDEMPRTPNGKLDRSALPAPDALRPQLEQGFEAPRTPVEKKIAEIWLTVLDVDRVGVHDNFFDLGGHSLLLLPVTHELQRAFDLRMIASELVHPTLGQLAALCEERMAKPEGPAPAGLMRRIYDAVRGSSPINGDGTQDLD